MEPCHSSINILIYTFGPCSVLYRFSWIYFKNESSLTIWSHWNRNQEEKRRYTTGTKRYNSCWHIPLILQVAKWMCRKGQGMTMGTFDTLLHAFDMEKRVDEAESFWNMILHTHERSISKRLFSRIISIYAHHNMPQNIIEVNNSCCFPTYIQLKLLCKL